MTQQQFVQLRLESQQNKVADEVSALIAVVRPILEGTLYSLKRDIVDQLGGTDKVTLEMMSRVYRKGDGDCGLCFEYAVHDAMNQQNSLIVDRVQDAISNHCGVVGSTPASILSGAEKTGALNLIKTAEERLTYESLLMVGKKGRPVKLKKHIGGIATAFRQASMRPTLPQSISGLWKADLFVGFSDSDKWIGTTVKINPKALEAAKGLRIGIVPCKQGRSDNIYVDEQKNLVVCPLPYDGDFMEIFYRGWGIVQQFFAADAQLPTEVNLPDPADREVARTLRGRRTYPVLDVLNALIPLAQPGLLKATQGSADMIETRVAENTTQAIVSPIPNTD